MPEPSKLQPGDKVVALSSLSRSVGIVSAFAAAIVFQVTYGVADFLTILFVFLPALTIGAIVGWLVSMRYSRGGPDGTTTVVKHGKDGVSVTIRIALLAGTLMAVIFFIVAKFALGFDGSWIGMLATIILPALFVSTVWALLASLA